MDTAGAREGGSGVGARLRRKEDDRLLRGRGQFVGDLKREGMLHAAILRSPVAHGRVAAIDAGAALALAGVRAVITAKDIGAVPRIPLRLLPLPGTERFLQPVIAADRVRYVGEPVAVVLGDSPALAEDGVGAIALDIEELPPVPDRHASGRGETLLFEEAGTNAAMVFTGVKGDADAAFRDADYVRRDRFAVQRHTALPMEPRGVLAEWDAVEGRMTVLPERQGIGIQDLHRTSGSSSAFRRFSAIAACQASKNGSPSNMPVNCLQNGLAVLRRQPCLLYHQRRPLSMMERRTG